MSSQLRSKAAASELQWLVAMMTRVQQLQRPQRRRRQGQEVDRVQRSPEGGGGSSFPMLASSRAPFAHGNRNWPAWPGCADDSHGKSQNHVCVTRCHNKRRSVFRDATNVNGLTKSFSRAASVNGHSQNAQNPQ